MTDEVKQVRALLGDKAQEVAGRVIALVDGRVRDIVTADGELTESGRSLLEGATAESPAPKRGRKPKAQTAEADVAADLRAALDGDDDLGLDD